MDFDAAIMSHGEWKIKLMKYLKKPDGSLLASDIRQDNLCILGKWIYGEGQKFSHLPEYQILKTQHAEFHKAAADVVEKADKGGDTSEDVSLGSSSKFSYISKDVMRSLMGMKAKV